MQPHNHQRRLARPCRICRASAAPQRRRGLAMIWVVLLGTVLIGMVGLAVDWAYCVQVAQECQNTADAAALAGAVRVRDGAAEARAAAIACALANRAAGRGVRLADNPGNGAAGDIVVGFYKASDRSFTPGLTGANAVKAVVRYTGTSLNGAVALVFGPAFGKQAAGITREAIAVIGGGTGAGLICLNEDEKWTFRLSGNVTLDVNDAVNPSNPGAAIQINSQSAEAIKVDGTSAILTASAINVYATTGDPPPPEVYDGPTNFSRPPIPDPLEYLEPPPLGTEQFPNTVKVANADTRTLDPGYYPGGILQTGGNLTLNPGIYCLGGEGLDITGGNLTAHGVMFYILPGTNKTAVTLTGNGIVDITPMPLESVPYGGIAIWQSRENTNPANLQGTNQFTGIDGTLYFPTSMVNITGTSDNFAIVQMIASQVGISGRGTVSINYDGRKQALGSNVYLAE